MAGFVAKLHRAAKNALMNYTPVEVVVRKATHRGLVLVDVKLMQQIAEYTYDSNYRREVMGILWKRLKDLGTYQHVLNALHLVDYLIRHGAMAVVQELRFRAVELEDLRDYVAPDEYKTYGGAVRCLASDIFQLLHDEPQFVIERKLAIETRMKSALGFPREALGGGGYKNGGTDSTSTAGSLDSVVKFDIIPDNNNLLERSESEESEWTIEDYEESDSDDGYLPVVLDKNATRGENQNLIPPRHIAPTIFYGDEVVPSSQLTQKILDYRRSQEKMSLGMTGSATATDEDTPRADTSADSEQSDSSFEVERILLNALNAEVMARQPRPYTESSLTAALTNGSLLEGPDNTNQSSVLDSFDFYWEWSYPTFHNENAWIPLASNNVTMAANHEPNPFERGDFLEQVSGTSSLVDEFGAPWFINPGANQFRPVVPFPGRIPSTNPFAVDYQELNVALAEPDQLLMNNGGEVVQLPEQEQWPLSDQNLNRVQFPNAGDDGMDSEDLISFEFDDIGPSYPLALMDSNRDSAGEGSFEGTPYTAESINDEFSALEMWCSTRYESPELAVNEEDVSYDGTPSLIIGQQPSTESVEVNSSRIQHGEDASAN